MLTKHLAISTITSFTSEVLLMVNIFFKQKCIYNLISYKIQLNIHMLLILDFYTKLLDHGIFQETLVYSVKQIH